MFSLQNASHLKVIRSALVQQFKKLCMEFDWADKELGAYDCFQAEFKTACKRFGGKKDRYVHSPLPALPIHTNTFLHMGICRLVGDPQQNTAAEVLTDGELLRLMDAWLEDGSFIATRDRWGKQGCIGARAGT